MICSVQALTEQALRAEEVDLVARKEAGWPIDTEEYLSA